MKRLVTNQLIEWSHDKNVLPLFIVGARQIGKTHSVLDFANNHYQDKYVYFNFLEKNEKFKLLIDTTSPSEIINTIKLITNKEIDESWLIIFDEIQEMTNIRSSLKLFVEQKLNYKIICLGSYLGNMLNDKQSFPVGKIKIIEMFPMNFEEFLMAKNLSKYITHIKEAINNKQEIDLSIHKFMQENLIEFLLVGGMPNVLDTYLKSKDLLTCNNIKLSLMNGYKNDIVKYIQSNSDKLKAQTIYENIPKFLAKQNKKYKLSNIDSTARFLNYENAIKNLLTTKIIYKINNIKNFASPIKIHKEESEFKIYYNDAGFIATVFDLNKQILTNKNDYGHIKGSLFENFVLSELVQKIDIDAISYYAFRDKNNNLYEIDYCIESIDGKIIPLEVKSNSKYKTKSLNKIIDDNNVANSIVFSSKNFNFKNKKKYLIPSYAVGFLTFENNRIKI